MPRAGYPPSHRRTDVPQPEVCDVTGFVVSGAELMVSEAPGLTGRRVSAASPFLARARNVVPELDEINVPEIIGQGRVYEPGMEPWFQEGPPGQQFFTPNGLDELVLWMRNDDIPYTSLVATWAAPAGLGLPSASQSSSSAQPAPQSDPFSTDRRAVRQAAGKYLTLASTVAFADEFSFVAAFRTPAALSSHRIAHHTTLNGAFRLLADGSLVVIVNGGSSATVAAAATFTTSTNYVLTVFRDGSGDITVRVNGTEEGSANHPGLLSLNTIGDSTGFGMNLDVAEIFAYGADYSGDTAVLRQIERHLGFLVGVDI